MKPNFTSTPSQSRPRFFQDVALHLEAGDFAAELGHLGVLRSLLSYAWKCVRGIGAMLTHPAPQHIDVDP
jgi:hypothetical protein